MRPWLFLGLLGCQEPFSVERHDLGPFRIAAMGVVDGVAAAAIWSGQGMVHPASPRLRWSGDGELLGEGYEVEVPDGVQALSLEATAGDGHATRQGVVSVAPTAPLPAFSRLAVTVGRDLSIPARAELEARPSSGVVPTEDAVRVVVDAGDDTETRWMLAEGWGTALELDRHTADLMAEEVVFEDGEVASRRALGEGTVRALALTLGGEGANRWQWIDAAVGGEGSWLRHAGRLFPVDEEVPPGLAASTLWVSAEHDGGVRLSEVIPVSDLTAQDELACAPAGRPFEVAWIVEGRCAGPDVDGARVVLEVW